MEKKLETAGIIGVIQCYNGTMEKKMETAGITGITKCYNGIVEKKMEFTEIIGTMHCYTGIMGKKIETAGSIKIIQSYNGIMEKRRETTLSLSLSQPTCHLCPGLKPEIGDLRQPSDAYPGTLSHVEKHVWQIMLTSFRAQRNFGRFCKQVHQFQR